MHFLHSCSLYISLSSSSPDARQSRAPFSFVGDQFIFFSRPLYDSEMILRGKISRSWGQRIQTSGVDGSKPAL